MDFLDTDFIWWVTVIEFIDSIWEFDIKNNAYI